MTRLRVLLLSAGAAGVLTAVTAGVRISLPQRALAQPAAAAPAASVPPTVLATTARTGAPAPDLRDVPAGIISRAARARALERAPACGQPGRRDAAACAPRRDTVEVQWDVGKAP